MFNSPMQLRHLELRNFVCVFPLNDNVYEFYDQSKQEYLQIIRRLSIDKIYEFATFTYNHSRKGYARD